MATHMETYKLRMYPDEGQKLFFSRTFGCARFMFNTILKACEENYRQRKEDPSIPKIKPTPAQYKEAYPFLKEVDSMALASAHMDVIRAFDNFFRNPEHFGYPQPRKKRGRQTYRTNMNGGQIKIFKRAIKLPKLKTPVKTKIHRKIVGRILSATIILEPSGKYYIALACEVEQRFKPKTGSAVGIDMGIESFATLSDGTVVDNPRYDRELEKKLGREQRKLSRRRDIAKKRGVRLGESKNYQKQRVKVARIHEKVRNQRLDFMHKLTSHIIETQDVVCVEDLNVKGMLKNRRLSRAISGVSWATFFRLLEYKAQWYGKTVVHVDRWYPSSQICSDCGHRDGKKTLNVREWACTNCGVVHHRDVNASRNILAEGLRILNSV